MPTVGSLLVELRADVASFKSNMEDARRSLGSIENATVGALAGIKNLVAGYLSLEGAARITHSIVDATVEVEKANLRLAAVVQATGGVAGYSAGELRQYAEALSRSSLFNSEEIKAAEAELSIFRNVHGETFKQVIALAMDLASLTGQDLLTSTRNLGRALNDPVNGYTMLGRSIGRLSPEVQRAIKDAAEHGDAMRAQKLMIDELSKSLGGNVSGGMATGMAGAVKNVGEAWREFKAQLGETPQIRDPIVNTLKTITAELRAMAEPLKTITPEFARLLAMSGGRPTSGAVGAFLGGRQPTGPAALGALGITGAGVTTPGTPPEKWHLAEPWPGAYSGAPKPLTDAEVTTAKKRQEQITAIMDALRKEADTTGLTSAQIKLYELAQLGASAAERKRAESLALLADIGDTRKDALRAAADAGTFKIDLEPELRTQAEQIRDFWAKHGKLAEQLGVPVGRPDDMSVFMHNMGLPSAKDLQDEAERMKATKGPDLYATAWKEAIRGIQQTFAEFYAGIFTATNSLRDLIVNMLNAIKAAAANLLATITTNWIGTKLHLPGYGGGGGGILPAPTEAPIFSMPTSNPLGRVVAAPAPSVVNVYMTNHLNAASFDPHTGAKLLQAQAPVLMNIWYKGMQDMGVQLGRRA